MSTRAIATDFIATRYSVRSADTVGADSRRGLLNRNGLEYTSGSAPASDKLNSTDALSQALKYIPTEVVTAYTMLLNLIPGTVVDALLWMMYGLFAALSGIAVYCQAKQQWNKLPTVEKSDKPWLVPWQGITAATVAFLAWGSAVPGTSFGRLHGYQSWMGLVAVVIVTLLLNLLDGTFDPAPVTRAPLVTDSN
jgi:hypothetical protein